jgi:hypothetical protein
VQTEGTGGQTNERDEKHGGDEAGPRFRGSNIVVVVVVPKPFETLV